MKVLLTHRYFWPDTAPYGAILRAIGEDLVAAGHSVHIFSSKPSYRKNSRSSTNSYDLRSLNIYRCWVFQEEGALTIVRALNVLIYSTALFLRIWVVKPDIVTVSTFPPVFAGFVASVASRLTGARLVYHVQDIHPEISEAFGGMMGRQPFSGLLRWIDNQTLKQADAIVVLSNDMAETIRSRNIGELPIHVINNFSLDEDGSPGVSTDVYPESPGRKRIIFAGNLGRFQNLVCLTEGVIRCISSRPDYELVFMGDGKIASTLKELWQGHPQVTFMPFMPFIEAKPIIAQSEIGLVSLTGRIYKYAYPSKVSTYLALGVPILAVIEPCSELSQELSDGGVGLTPASDSVEDIAIALDELIEKSPRSLYVASWYRQRFSRATSTSKWLSLLAEM